MPQPPLNAFSLQMASDDLIYIAMQCDVERRPGFVLVEAKAHVFEHCTDGKREAKGDAKHPRSALSIAKSAANHVEIGVAIREAQRSLAPLNPGIGIDGISTFSCRTASLSGGNSPAWASRKC